MSTAFSDRLRCLSVGLVLLALCAVQSGCRSGGEKPAPEPAKPRSFPVDRLGEFYKANALIEMDQEKAAGELLTPMLESIGREPALVANLAVVRLAALENDKALALSSEADAAATNNADIALIHGASLRAVGRHDECVAYLTKAADRHPTDVRIRWMLLQTMDLVGNAPSSEALNHYERLLDVSPRNLAALLAGARAAIDGGSAKRADQLLRRALAQIGDPSEGIRKQLIALDEAAKSKNAGKLRSVAARVRNLLLATDRYQTDVIALGASSDQTPPPVRHPVWAVSGDSPDAIDAEVRFSEAAPGTLLPERSSDAPIRRIVAGTISADRSPALFVIDAEGDARLLDYRDKQFADVTAKVGLDGLSHVRNALFVDLNNDRRMDLYVCGEKGDRYFRQSESGRFDDVTKAIGLDAETGSHGAQSFDFDNEGDLDLLTWDAKRLRLYQNDGEGNLKFIDSRPGLPMDMAAIQSIRTLDLDDDGDIDLLITTGDGPYALRVISNERLASFREVTDALGDFNGAFEAMPEVADFDNDGWLELIDIATGRRLAFGPEFAMKAMPPIDMKLPAASMAIADVDNNGNLDAVPVDREGVTAYDDVRVTSGASLTAIDLDSDGRMDLLSSAGQAFLNKTQRAGNWLSVALVGLNTGDSRFKALGLGSTIEIRSGAHYQKRHVQSATTHFGLGPFAQADVMRVVWPNGNYQSLEFRAHSQTGLAGNRQIVEEQTLKGSCPYLYAWNGERFEFVTDVLWRSALGMSIMQGVYGHHGTADDYFKIEGDRLVPVDGAYRLSFTEELWETSYFDYCRLLVVDHPSDTEVYVDEKCLTPPYPPFEILKVADHKLPLSATDERDRDLLPMLQSRDGYYVDGFRQTRYQGLVESHDLILDLGPFDQDAPVRLFLQGWLWPTDASTNVAVSQNPDVSPRMPHLQVIGEDGAWIESERVVGFPSGKAKTIAIDLTNAFPTSDHRVRLRTNFCIYWDHVFFTTGPQQVETRVTELTVDRAELRERGISVQYRQHPGGPRIPDYDALDSDAQWRDLVGGYTPTGDVTPLLQRVDDDYAIVGAGDEVLMWFDAADVPELPKGWERSFIVHTDGWLKDGDLNSASGKTVGPLPWHEMSGYPTGAERENTASNIGATHTRFRDQSSFRGFIRDRGVNAGE